MANFHYRILVVDDDEQIRQVSERVLSHCGYDVRTASHGFEALVLMRKALPDLIVSDLNMPNMSGFELLSIVRRRFPQVPVIAITGEYTAPEPEALLADAIFHKGQYSPDQLFKEIQSLLEHSPIRPYLPKLEKAPVWIPRNGNYVVLTCTDCLRSFSISEQEAERGLRELPCVYCNTQILFNLEPKRTP
jgi:CheY-like chemotaxis protein/DNA-directed RNA polymerase subunit RPC12/RpoP